MSHHPAPGSIYGSDWNQNLRSLCLSVLACKWEQALSHCLARLLWTDFGMFEAELWGEYQPSLCVPMQPHILETSAGRPSMRSLCAL